MLTQRTKLILSGIGVVVVVAILATAIVFVRQPSRRRPPLPTTSQPPATQVRLDGILEAVFRGASPEKCLEAGARTAIDQCFFAVATSRADADLCVRISDENQRAACVGIVATSEVALGGNPELCFSLADADARSSCILAAVDGGVDETYCGRFSGAEQTLCANRVLLVRGTETGDLLACAGISDEELRDECMSAAGTPAEPVPEAPVDTDGDGLTDEEEAAAGTNPESADTDADSLTDFAEIRTYQSDPLSADTDGDGFSDGTEVENGYNPNGPGPL